VFTTMLERLINDICTALASLKPDEGEEADEPAERLTADLVILRAALEEIDLEVINRTIDSLSGHAKTERTKTAVRNLSKHILLFEYDEAVTLIDTLLPGH